MSADAATPPLSDLLVLDFGHTVMGPACSLILADLGARVIKIEPAPQGEPTRYLKGFGTGYFGYFNRNKQSVAIDLKSEKGRDIALDMVRRADIIIENFAPGTMDRLGLGYEALAKINTRLVYAELKGFFPGPYAKRVALDEVVQMMTGLAYMTGPSGRPLRAGTSIVDITGGLFAVIAIMTALRERERSGKGQKVGAALYETAVFLMGQHLCYSAQSPVPVPPMPERVSAWSVYDLFTLADGSQLFVGITSDRHWQRFCTVTGRDDLARNPVYASNNQRNAARPVLMPILSELFVRLSHEEAEDICETAGIPFAPIARPEDLFNDPHLSETGGLLPTTLPNGVETHLPRLPVMLQSYAPALRNNPPAVGEHTRDVLSELGYSPEALELLKREGIIA